MAEVEITVGDKVRVHFHPPNPLKSFSEGVVRRVDVATPHGRVFVVEVAHEVLLDREHRIRPGFQDPVLYDCRNDFPGRIEVLSAAIEGEEQEPAADLLPMEPPTEEQEAIELSLVGLEAHSEPETEPVPKAETVTEPTHDEGEREPARKQGGLIATLFARKEQ